MTLVNTIGKYVAAGAFLGILLLIPLYLSQRRDLLRLTRWMATAPGHPAADLAASEALLDRAEAELEALDPGRFATPTPAAPTTSDRPALEQITMEREALAPHPRWRRFVAVATRPRVLAVVALASALAGAAGIVISDRLVESGQPAHSGRRPGAVNPHDVNVAVLNGTPVPGLAAKVGGDVRENGFQLGTVTNSRRQYDQTVVMFSPGQQAAAEKVAHDLGVKPVQPIDARTSGLVSGADVVVIAGRDRTR